MRMRQKGQNRFRWSLASCIILLLLLAVIIIWTPRMPGKSYSGPFPPLSEKEKAINSNLHKHVYKLAGEIGERNIWLPSKLNAAAAYIEKTWSKQNYTVRHQEYSAKGVKSANLEIEIPGTSQADEIVLVGAHYDSVLGSPGANDNGSGVAALLEISRLLGNRKLARTIRFVAFTNEEPPFFLRRDMGSKVYASRARKRCGNSSGHCPPCPPTV